MSRAPTEVSVEITGLSADGLGTAELDGRALQVRNALPGETVQARILRRRRGKLLADGVGVSAAHADRVESACMHFPRCGGCSLHHLAEEAQLQHKQQQLARALAEHCVPARSWSPPCSAGRLGYRRKARLGVRRVGEQVFVGFRESFSNRVARLDECRVLTPALSSLLGPLRELIARLSIADRIPQIEVAQGDGPCVLMVRHLAPFSAADIELWKDLQGRHAVRVLLQSGGYETLQSLDGSPPGLLGYQIPEAGLYLQFQPQQFTQVNLSMNHLLIRQVLAYLGELQGKKVVDLFCGIGNFTLPLARRGARVWGYEAAADAVKMAQQNARLNGLSDRVAFTVEDLYADGGASGAVLPPDADALVLDPPRSGAGANLAGWLRAFGGDEIVYVSCNPESFAADAAVLRDGGFDLDRVGIYDMFPHTAHVETMGYFLRRGAA